jgi:selenocysteine lyase/cysteine desulfurase
MPLDLPSMYVDVASGGSYKWLCAPEGCGIFYVSERVRDRVRPLTRGWTSVANFFDFEDRDQPMTEDASAWETGLIGSAMYYGLEQSLELLNKSGVDRIANYLEELTDYLCESIPSDRYRVYSSRTPGEKSQIVSLLPMNGSTSDQIAERLAREGIIVSARGDLVRVAPHFFNNSEDIERMVAAL